MIDTCRVQIGFKANWCNDWPRVEVIANQHTKWQGPIIQSQSVEIEFARQVNNNLRVVYLNKRNGPDLYDTIVADGQIIADQNCIVSTINIDGARCDWLIPDMVYHRIDGSQDFTHGFMDQKGYFVIEFPQDVYTWVSVNRRAKLPQRQRRSSLAYEDVYIPDTNNDQIRDLMDQIDLLINDIHE